MTPDVREATRLWTLSEAYNVRYGENFYNLRVGERQLYDDLTSLNNMELDIVRQSIADTADACRLPAKLQRMQQFVDKQFGYVIYPGIA